MPPAAARQIIASEPVYKIVNSKPFSIGLSGLGGTRGFLILGAALMVIASTSYTLLGKKKLRKIKNE